MQILSLKTSPEIMRKFCIVQKFIGKSFAIYVQRDGGGGITRF